ncbi:hypothetical protein BDV95DRAFT_592658 [Massariosphaeria phaeospora]|uniref:Uncharacterized protein n=1 Tax=Massariosphaeria phaeospora TaxID=100035 RepID=A0A7C8IAI8_9PLEO|nr:hypothetical protein BDV95DRAFT_592658 [Massariosphaeria phaeospora]
MSAARMRVSAQRPSRRSGVARPQLRCRRASVQAGWCSCELLLWDRHVAGSRVAGRWSLAVEGLGALEALSPAAIRGTQLHHAFQSSATRRNRSRAGRGHGRGQALANRCIGESGGEGSLRRWPSPQSTVHSPQSTVNSPHGRRAHGDAPAASAPPPPQPPDRNPRERLRRICIVFAGTGTRSVWFALLEVWVDGKLYAGAWGSIRLTAAQVRGPCVQRTFWTRAVPGTAVC